MPTKNLLLGLALIPVAVGLGFAAAYAVILALNWMLPPFQIEDDDTLRDYGPVALAYVAWVVTTLVTLVVGWRRLRRSPLPPSK
jgi:hypothetical protein